MSKKIPASVRKARAGLIPSLYSDGIVLKEAKVVLDLEELNALIGAADKALDGDSNDTEHDALYSIREKLSEMSIDLDRRRDK